jgi:hypothetical protein
MNIKLSFAVLMISFVFVASPCFAGTAEDGTKVSIDVTESGGGVLEYTQSPNVSLGYTIDDDTFIINSVNTRTDTTNGLEYAVVNDKSGYFQRTKTDSFAALDSEPDWTYMGSS